MCGNPREVAVGKKKGALPALKQDENQHHPRERGSSVVILESANTTGPDRQKREWGSKAEHAGIGSGIKKEEGRDKGSPRKAKKRPGGTRSASDFHLVHLQNCRKVKKKRSVSRTGEAM